MFTDLRHAVRLLLKAPGFTAIVVLVLTLGIGANTVIFSIVNGVLLKPLPFAEAQRLVAIQTTVRNEPDGTAYLDFLDWRAQASTIELMAAYTTAAATLTGHGDAASIPLALVTPDLFPMLGVAPIQGRVFGGPKCRTPDTSARLSATITRDRRRSQRPRRTAAASPNRRPPIANSSTKIR